MRQERRLMLEFHVLLLAVAALFIGCGGGANNQNAAVSLSVVFIEHDGEDRDYIEAEMIKTLATTSINVNVKIVKIISGDLNESASIVDLKSYSVVFRRTDGGSPTLPTVNGSINKRLDLNDVEIADFEIPVVSVRDKLYSEFAVYFYNNRLPATEFEAVLTVYGENLARQSVQAEYTFRVQCAVYLPIDSLLPSIDFLTESSEITTLSYFNASWSVSTSRFPVDRGTYRSPWGSTTDLSSDDFPAGGISIDASILRDSIEQGETAEFPPGLLEACNFMGCVTEQGSIFSLDVYRPYDPGAEPVEEVSINTFVADRYSITEGDSVNLSWIVTGGATSVSLFPNTYHGVLADLSGKDPAYDSVSIMPDFSVKPFLRAVRTTTSEEGITSVQSLAVEFLDSTITVVKPVDDSGGTAFIPPEILVFTPSRSTVGQSQQVTLYWSLQGDIDKVEIFPINNQPLDVTGRNYLLTPPHSVVGTQVYTIVVSGKDGSVVSATTSIAVTSTVNQAIVIRSTNQQPGSSINNGDQGSFSFQVFDPERADSSWQVDKIAGDSASFFPRTGQIPGGLGDVAVSFQDADDNVSGYLIFQISAFDDSNFGRTRGSTKAVQLLTFQTTGTVGDNAPTITDAAFTAGDALSTEGVISFRFSDPDTLDLSWSVSITAGDFGGTLSPSSGRVSTGSGAITVNYQDDADTPDAPVTFLIRVAENTNNNPQADVQLLSVTKGAGDDGSGTTPPPTTGPIGFVYSGLFADLSGQVSTANEISDFSIFSNGDNSTNPIFYRNSDQSAPVSGLSAIFEFNHESRDPSSIRAANYTRNFIEVSSNPDNTGAMTFGGYFGSPRQTGSPSNTPITNGISRWFMQFGAGAFRNSSSSNFNLPTTGSRDYSIQVVVQDSTGNSITVNKTLRITVAQ